MHQPSIHDEEHGSTFGISINDRCIEVAGEVDYFSSVDLASQLRSAISSAGKTSVDLRGLTFIDCAGARAFAEVISDIAEDGGSVRFLNVPPCFERVWSALELDGRVPAVLD